MIWTMMVEFDNGRKLRVGIRAERQPADGASIVFADPANADAATKVTLPRGQVWVDESSGPSWSDVGPTVQAPSDATFPEGVIMARVLSVV